MDITQLTTALLVTLIAGPVVLGLAAWLAPGRTVRGAVVTLAALVTAAAGILLAVKCAHGTVEFTLGDWSHWTSFGLEAVLCVTILGIAIGARSWTIGILAAIQLGLVASGPFLPAAHGLKGPDLIIDPLSIILVLIVSVVGSAIVVYAIGYMKRHEEHAPATAASTGSFFLFLVGFLGVMNGLVLANDLRWLAGFWEATTLCSFMLIRHDRTEEARANARRALLINTFGGVAMALAGVIMALQGQPESLTGIMNASGLPIAQVVMLLMCLAAFTKSAQMPFQSWLLGAMVAPTPVSALLHSATMVKAGSYLVLRLSPAFVGTTLMGVVAVAGAFTFAACSALAISQSNGKKVLAYSTIANLGLIVACAGINTPLAYAAALMILCFHAISKGLLFLCVGTIEQSVGSRDIDDMGGIMRTMPLTTVLALVGMISMLAPPFAMLLSKWIAIEAAIHSPLVLVLVVLGSAFTVLFWSKWIGRIQTVSYHEKYELERIPASMSSTMLLLGIGVLAAGVLAIPLYNSPFVPMAMLTYGGGLIPAGALQHLTSVGSLPVGVIFLFLGLALVAALVSTHRFTARNVRAPFLCGENVEVPDVTYAFRGVMDKTETSWSASFYLRPLFAEERLTVWANLVATMIILTLFGVIGAI